MRKFKLNNGLEIPAFGLGTWLSNTDEVYRAVRHAIRLGYRHIDCAHIYQNEDEIGNAISDAIKGKGTLPEISFGSLPNSGITPTNQKECKKLLGRVTLKNLQLDYLDLYLMHWPIAFSHDKVVPESSDDFVNPSVLTLGDTWEAMEALVEKGLAKSIGVSNFNQSHLKEISRKPLKSNPL